jgi:hypothetical protein
MQGRWLLVVNSFALVEEKTKTQSKAEMRRKEMKENRSVIVIVVGVNVNVNVTLKNTRSFRLALARLVIQARASQPARHVGILYNQSMWYRMSCARLRALK